MSLRSLILGNTGVSSRQSSLFKVMRYEEDQTQIFHSSMSPYAVKSSGRVESSVYNLGLSGDIRIRAGSVKSFVTTLLIAFINIFSSTNTVSVKLLLCHKKKFPAISLMTCSKGVIFAAVR